MNYKIKLSSPHLEGDELEYIRHSLNSSLNVSYKEEFEKELMNYLAPGSYVAALNSGTSALHMALILLGVQPGDEVICQSMTFSASSNPIVYLGADPVFVDSEKSTWNICPDFLEEAIVDRIKKGKKPKAVIAVHLYGMPANMEKVVQVCRNYEIPVVEDAAEALGSMHNGRKVGTIGDFGIVSFNINKIITTGGGGALISSNLDLIEKARFLSTQARDAASHYQHSEIGYNYTLGSVPAGIGLAQIKVLEQRITRRRAVYEFYKNVFAPIDEIQLLNEPGKEYFSNRWLSSALLKFPENSWERLKYKLKNNLIESRPLWKPMHLQPVYQNCPFYGNGTSERLFQRGICLPSGSNLTNEDLESVVSVCMSFINNFNKNKFYT